MLNMVQYNGYYSCPWCFHPGICIEGYVKFPVTEGPSPNTTGQALIEDKREAAATSRIVRGIKGPSVLLTVLGISIIKSFVPDYMHACLLGTVRQITDLWFSDVGADYYIGAPTKRQLIDERLQSLKPPSCFTRCPKSVKQRGFWKAGELQSWLLYFSLPCVYGILPSTYHDHFALLVAGIYLLMKSRVTEDDVALSNEKLTRFVVMLECLYHKREMKSNVHVLHLPNSVRLHGPLWGISCFAFETNMGHLLNLVSSSNSVPLQIFSRILMRNNFYQLRSLASDNVQDLCSHEKPSLGGTIEPLSKSKACFPANSRMCQGTVWRTTED
ncbi:uncharacterized protein LOC135397673 [Ornithodoros turicata]|uniref:uncharacterized protein LOC135397673 n=1 Tax=Ornithodoros turicata TaxID=34597 RepID=UPI003138F0D4